MIGAHYINSRRQSFEMKAQISFPFEAIKRKSQRLMSLFESLYACVRVRVSMSVSGRIHNYIIHTQLHTYIMRMYTQMVSYMHKCITIYMHEFLDT